MNPIGTLNRVIARWRGWLAKRDGGGMDQLIEVNQCLNKILSTPVRNGHPSQRGTNRAFIAICHTTQLIADLIFCYNVLYSASAQQKTPA